MENVLHRFEPITRALGAAGNWPPLRKLRAAWLHRKFLSNRQDNMFWGVFDSFDEAAASAPPSRLVGYDNASSAQMYQHRLWIEEFDYPAMFWLARSLSEGMRTIVDLGGSVGIKYFAFGKVMDFPPDLVWRVIDVPAVAAQGRVFAHGRGVTSGLEFSDRLADIQGMDVIFASGVLQYMPQSLGDVLGSIDRLPRRLIVNTTAIHADKQFFTLNNIGTAYCPYRVQARTEFVESIKAKGYVLRDKWDNSGKYLRLALHPELSLSIYSGFCFDRVGG